MDLRAVPTRAADTFEAERKLILSSYVHAGGKGEGGGEGRGVDADQQQREITLRARARARGVSLTRVPPLMRFYDDSR